MVTRRLAVVVALGLVAACERTLTEVPRGPQQEVSAVGVDIARGLAGALTRPNVRTALIQLMRKSPIVEHRVPLADALGAGGGAVLQEAARSLGVSAGAFRTAAAALGQADLYLADGHQRQTWTVAGAPARVAFSTDGKNYFMVDAAGSTSPLTQATKSDNPVFVLAPPEATSYRIGRPVGIPAGDVVEDPSDAGGGLIVEVWNALGQLVAQIDLGRDGVKPEDLNGYLERIVSSGKGATPLSTTSLTTYVGTAVEIFENERITDPIGSAEIELKTWKDKAQGIAATTG